MANKPHLSITDQIKLLKSRGMQFSNEAKAAEYLQNISYYRLKGYWWDMQADKVNHVFEQGSRFDDVLDRYNFDRHLRLILLDAIERIEIALRAKMVFHLSALHGPLWYEDDRLAIDASKHAEHLSELRNEFSRSKEIFAVDHRKRRQGHSPDVWLILETASMGLLSKIYKNFPHQLAEKSKIANEMGLNLHSELDSWLEAITYLRNIVAHHSRLWGRPMVKMPTVNIRNPKSAWLDPISSLQHAQAKRAFTIISCMLYICNHISPGHSIKSKILDLIKKNPSMRIGKVGFIRGWESEPLWR